MEIQVFYLPICPFFYFFYYLKLNNSLFIFYLTTIKISKSHIGKIAGFPSDIHVTYLFLFFSQTITCHK